jgi:hypothetical protein
VSERGKKSSRAFFSGKKRGEERERGKGRTAK